MKTKPHSKERYQEFIRENRIGIGWPGIGSLQGVTKDEVRDRVRTVYQIHDSKLGNALGAIWSFVYRMQAGDLIGIRHGSLVSIGIVGDYEYVPSLDNPADGFCHQRSVEWLVVEEEMAYFSEKFQETIGHRGIVTKSKYSLDELQLKVARGRGKIDEFISNEK